MTGLPVPRDLHDITPAWLSAALGNVGGRGGASVRGYSVEAIAEGKGFMSQLFRLRPDYGPDPDGLPSSLIVKLPTVDPLLRQIFDKLAQNRREALFYREVETGDHLLTPEVYHCAVDPATGDSVLVQQDMSGTPQGDSVAGCSMDRARNAITQLARFHAAWWDSPRLNELDWMPPRESEANAYRELYADAWKSFVEKAGGGMPERLRALGDRLGEEIPRIKAMLGKRPMTISHGDYRLDNFFFIAGEGSERAVVFDWEFCVRGRGAYDVATFISDSFAPERRRKEELGLLRTYHSTLAANGVEGYPFEECLSDYRLSMLEEFVFWVVAGGYCDYEGDRATVYLHNSLERFDAAISDLASVDLLTG